MARYCELNRKQTLYQNWNEGCKRQKESNSFWELRREHFSSCCWERGLTSDLVCQLGWLKRVEVIQNPGLNLDL